MVDETAAKLILLILGAYLASGIYHLYLGELNPLQFTPIIIIFIFALVNIFIVPKVIYIRWIASILSTIAAISVISGLPSLIIGEYTFYGFHFSPYGQPEMFPVIDGLNSYFNFMNGMNRLTVYGFFSSWFLSLKYPTKVWKFILAINSAGVILSSRRQTILLLVLLLPVVIAYWWYNAKQVLSYISQYFYLSLTFGIITLFLFVITPLSIPLIDISTRMEIWERMWLVVVNNPLVGTGPREFIFSPHSGYLLAGVTSGSVGLVAYLMLPIVLFRHVRRVSTIAEVYVLLIIYSTFIFQFFEIYNFVGINFDSTVTAIFIGVLIMKTQE